MSSLVVPTTPTKEVKSNYFIKSPLKESEQDEVVNEHKKLFDRFRHAQKQQDVLDNSVRFLHAQAKSRGLLFNLDHLSDLILSADDPGDSDDDEDAPVHAESSEEDSSEEEEREKSTEAVVATETEESRKVGAVNARLTRITLDIADELTKDALTQYRLKYVQELVKLEVEQLRDNKRERVTLSEENVFDITNFWFNELFGPKGWNRVVALVQEHNDQELGSENALATRAMNLASDPTRPKICRETFSILGQCVELSEKRSDVTRGFHLNRKLVHLRAQYDELCKKVRKGGRKIKEEFATVQVEVGPGHDIAGQCKQYLESTLQIQKSAKLTNMLFQAKLLVELIEDFGNGIVVLLPTNAARFLQGYGAARFVATRNLFLQVTQDGREELYRICDLLEKYVYDPLSRGEALGFKLIKGQANKPMLTRLLEVIDTAESSDQEMAD